MHAITCSEFGGPDVLRWEEVPTPEPKAGEVLVKVAAAGMNRADLLQREGKYPPPKGASDIIGLEVSGEVVALGDNVTRWKVGSKVCALLSGGGYAEYVAVPAGQCLPVPEGLSMNEAAALPEAVATVWANLFESAQLKSGEFALIHGGGSGIGTTAIKMAKLFGAKVFVTVNSDEKGAACKNIGADFPINYQTQDFVAVIKEITNGRGVHVVLDMIGADYINRNIEALAPLGRHVSIGIQHGRMAEVDMWLVMHKRLTLTGSTLRTRAADEKARIIGEIKAKVWPWVAQGMLKPLIYGTYPIKNAAEAHKVMESRAQLGKIVLEVTS